MSAHDAPIMSEQVAVPTSRQDAVPTDACSKTHPSLPFSVQVRAPEGHEINKDELGNELEMGHEQNDPTMERPIAASHEAPPEKCKDPGAFTVTCGGPLKPPKLLVELEDKSCIRPVGLLDDLTLHVCDLVVHADFYVLQMRDARSEDLLALILGCPFFFATKPKIDIDTGLSLAFRGKRSNFYIYKDDDCPCTKKPLDIVHTPYLAALSFDLPDKTCCAANEVAMSRVFSQTREDVKANPPDQWRADPRTLLYEYFGQTEGVAEVKFDLTQP
ncbi:unnamed protein product [Rhodiola kirilowii]